MSSLLFPPIFRFFFPIHTSSLCIVFIISPLFTPPQQITRILPCRVAVVKLQIIVTNYQSIFTDFVSLPSHSNHSELLVYYPSPIFISNKCCQFAYIPSSFPLLPLSPPYCGTCMLTVHSCFFLLLANSGTTLYVFLVVTSENQHKMKEGNICCTF